MLHRIQTLIMLLLIALVPVRAIAAVAIGFHSADYDPVASHAYQATENAAMQHRGNESPGDATHSCNYSTGHCVGTLVVLPPGQLRIPAMPIADAIPFTERLAAVFVPEHPERPPLSR